MPAKHGYLRIASYLFVGVIGLLFLNHSLPNRIVFNKTPSMELGFYFLKKSETWMLGDIVQFKYMEPAWLDRRQYFKNGDPFLKRIVGEPGDTVKCANRTLEICRNNKCVKLDKGKDTDMQGRFVTAWCPVEHTLASDEYLVAGDFSEHSLDSRFLGPIKRGQLTHLATKLF